MITDTSNKISQYLKEKGQATASELIDYLGISRQALYKQLAKLQKKQEIYKLGRPPKVFYYVAKKKTDYGDVALIDEKNKKIIEDNFLFITPAGEKKQGLEAFSAWCAKYNLPPTKTAEEYVLTLKKYNQYRRPDGLIDGTEKIKKIFPNFCLDNLYYLDFYSIERFGKTKLGQFLLYAKQSQNRQIIKELIANIKERIEEAIQKEKIDAVIFVPPTVKREVQFMKELEKNLSLSVRKIIIEKIKTEIAVPQKTLNKLEDRMENARKTFVLKKDGVYNNILLIDDAVGSGATFNEIACKIKSSGICNGKIIGLAITGSFKGFDVISEV
jgi:hypoxanthine-guanine phosphoribosyltransferase